MPTLLNQLSTYDPILWLCFAAATYIASRQWGWRGTIAAHLCVAFLVLQSDVAWVQAERNRQPPWADAPDIDLFFSWGCMLRVLLINTILLPIAILALWQRASKIMLRSTT